MAFFQHFHILQQNLQFESKGHNLTDWKKFVYDATVEVDTKGATKLHVLSARGSFTRFSKDERGLPVWNEHENWTAIVQDDLTALQEVKMVMEGWAWSI